MKLHQLITENAIAHSIIPLLLRKGEIIHFKCFDKNHIIQSISPHPNKFNQYSIRVGNNPGDVIYIPDEYLENAVLKKVAGETHLLPDFTWAMSAQAHLDSSGEKDTPTVHVWADQLKDKDNEAA